jgi:hypothetical protein
VWLRSAENRGKTLTVEEDVVAGRSRSREGCAGMSYSWRFSGWFDLAGGRRTTMNAIA